MFITCNVAMKMTTFVKSTNRFNHTVGEGWKSMGQ